MQVVLDVNGWQGGSQFEFDILSLSGTEISTGGAAAPAHRCSFPIDLTSGPVEVEIRASSLVTLFGSADIVMTCTVVPDPIVQLAPLGASCGLTLGLAADPSSMSWTVTGASPGYLVAWAAGTGAPPMIPVPTAPGCVLYVTPDVTRFGVADGSGRWAGSEDLTGLTPATFSMQAFAFPATGVLASQGWTVQKL